jgi:hypothetical protein
VRFSSVSLSSPSVRRLARVLAVLTTAVLTAALLSGPPAQAGSQHHRVSTWASVGSATITPGVMMYTAGAQCTANFVFTDSQGHVYVGYAAHCAGTGEATDTNGCKTRSLPLGTPASFTSGGSILGDGTKLGSGRLAYSSWLTMQKLGTKSADVCAYNDLALVRVSRHDVGKVNPSVPHWGGPTGLDTDGTAAGDPVYSYGNSSLRAGIAELSPKTGSSLGDAAADHGWSHPVYTMTPGIPGDSGSGFLSAGGKALGVLSTLGQKPSGIPGLKLALGTKRFSSSP